jgi:aromatic-L-amino-acid/L-tryptophan decarboxylase
MSLVRDAGSDPDGEPKINPDLDPEDWRAFRVHAHRMLDDIIDYVENIRDRPTWRPMPDDVRASFDEPLPRSGQPLSEVHAQFMSQILPYATGNVHPGFMGWVHGGGNVYGMLGEMLAAGLNPNLGGRDHAPIELERQVLRWFADLFGFPNSAGGLLVTGTSIANFIGVLVARVEALDVDVRRTGMIDEHRLVAYTSAAAHESISKALQMAGIGSDALRQLPVDDSHRMNISGLAAAIGRDRVSGYRPFLVIGTAGTVDIGAFDDLAAIAQICRENGLWFHVDGAFGVLGILAPEVRPALAGIEQADSIAFDFHKWGQVPYDAGCIIVRDRAAQLRAFAAKAGYLRREVGGLASGTNWPCDLGPDLSRGFRALKIWFTLKTLGTERLGSSIERTCVLARYLAERVDAEPELERAAPVPLNIVCFRYRFSDDSDRRNGKLAVEIQESGVAAPSTTILNGRVVLRCAIVNHRTSVKDIDALIEAALILGKRQIPEHHRV